MTKVVDDIAAGPQVAEVPSPFAPETVSEDRTTAYTTITYDATSDNLTEATREALLDAVQDGRDAGLTVEAGGSAVDGGRSSAASPN